LFSQRGNRNVRGMFSGEHATHIMGRRYSLRGIPVGALKECQRYIRIKTDKSYGNHEGKR
ncbi:hypothetical protein, partial [Bilophila wadsworthia]